MYHIKNLAKLKLLGANAAEGMKAFWAFDQGALAEGAIPVKYKELIALGVGFTMPILHRNSFEPSAPSGGVRSGGCRSRRSRGGFARRRRKHSRVTRNEGA